MQRRLQVAVGFGWWVSKLVQSAGAACCMLGALIAAMHTPSAYTSTPNPSSKGHCAIAFFCQATARPASMCMSPHNAPG